MKNPENKNSKSGKPESEKPESEKAEKQKGRAGREGREGRAGSNERDGITEKRLPWQGEALAILDGIGTGKRKQWFTIGALERMLLERLGKAPGCLTYLMLDMVKHGYLERAYRPERMRDKYQMQNNYIYRRTDKPFKEKAMMIEAWKGMQIRFEYPKHDKWFREMMQY